MQKQIAFLATVLLTTIVPCGAQVSFQQAVQDYNNGKHFLALSELKTYQAAYPNNALVHYYIALCEQALGHINQAKTEYQWVSQNGDARLKGLATSGLGQLSNLRTSGSSSTSSVSQSPSSAISVASAPKNSNPVKEILCFHADW